jgi:hypothetical protein
MPSLGAACAEKSARLRIVLKGFFAYYDWIDLRPDDIAITGTAGTDADDLIQISISLAHAIVGFDCIST